LKSPSPFEEGRLVAADTRNHETFAISNKIDELDVGCGPRTARRGRRSGVNSSKACLCQKSRENQ
jgi:hypothetical protein